MKFISYSEICFSKGVLTAVSEIFVHIQTFLSIEGEGPLLCQEFLVYSLV
jgi:hypothetical protein